MLCPDCWSLDDSMLHCARLSRRRYWRARSGVRVMGERKLKAQVASWREELRHSRSCALGEQTKLRSLAGLSLMFAKRMVELRAAPQMVYRRLIAKLSLGGGT